MITILKTIQARPRMVAVDSSLENSLLFIINVEVEVTQLFKNNTCSILVSYVEIFFALMKFLRIDP